MRGALPRVGAEKESKRIGLRRVASVSAVALWLNLGIPLSQALPVDCCQCNVGGLLVCGAPPAPGDCGSCTLVPDALCTDGVCITLTPTPTITITRTPTLTPTVTPTFGTDHFKCYRVRDEGFFQQRPISLMDQFVSKDASVIKPLYLCNPVEKNLGGQTVTVQHPDDHLVCYKIRDARPRFDKLSVRIQNQFGDNQKLLLLAPGLVCVPSRKTPLITPPTVTRTPTATRTPSASPSRTPTRTPTALP